MATIKYLLQGKGELTNIYLRLSIDRDNVFKRRSGYSINSKDWSAKKAEPIQRDETLKNLKSNLDKLKVDIQNRLNEAINSQTTINGHWLQEQLDLIHGVTQKKDNNRLINHFQTYIDNLKYKRDSKTKKPISDATIKKYATIRGKVIAFEKYKNKEILIKDIDLNFRKDFINYLAKVENLSNNTIGRYITFIKTVCKDAKLYGIKTNSQLDGIKGFTEEAAKIYFTFDELEIIENVKLERIALQNARDWLLIGCYIGQRVSDVLNLNISNITRKGNLDLIELTQQKTGKHVVIPITDKLRAILNKREGKFPNQISAVKFNKHIKDVAEEAGITKMTEGAKYDEETKRKQTGTFPKHELVTSHIMRRSFATNYYGEMPTPLIISITGHSTEAQFLEYVGKPPIDHAEAIAEYFNMVYQKQMNNKEKNEHKLTVVKKAN